VIEITVIVGIISAWIVSTHNEKSTITTYAYSCTFNNDYFITLFTATYS